MIKSARVHPQPETFVCKLFFSLRPPPSNPFLSFVFLFYRSKFSYSFSGKIFGCLNKIQIKFIRTLRRWIAFFPSHSTFNSYNKSKSRYCWQFTIHNFIRRDNILFMLLPVFFFNFSLCLNTLKWRKNNVKFQQNENFLMPFGTQNVFFPGKSHGARDLRVWNQNFQIRIPFK